MKTSNLIKRLKNFFAEKPKPKFELIGSTTFEERNVFNGKIIFKGKVSVFRRVLNGVSKEIFANVGGETRYFDCEIFDTTKILVLKNNS